MFKSNSSAALVYEKEEWGVENQLIRDGIEESKAVTQVLENDAMN